MAAFDSNPYAGVAAASEAPYVITVVTTHRETAFRYVQERRKIDHADAIAKCDEAAKVLGITLKKK